MKDIATLLKLNIDFQLLTKKSKKFGKNCHELTELNFGQLKVGDY